MMLSMLLEREYVPDSMPEIDWLNIVNSDNTRIYDILYYHEELRKLRKDELRKLRKDKLEKLNEIHT